MKAKGIITTLTLATLLTMGGAYKAHADVQKTGNSIPVYRLYNTHSGEHFYSTS